MWTPRVAPAVLYLVARGWQLLMPGPPVVSPDTEMYRSPGQRLFQFDLVTFTGEGGLRPWPVTLPFALVSTDEGRVVLQFLLSCSPPCAGRTAFASLAAFPPSRD